MANNVQVTTKGVVASNPAITPTNPLAGQPITVTTNGGKAVSVAGQVANTSCIFKNPS